MVRRPTSLVVFNARTLKAYASQDSGSFPNEIEAFQVPLRHRRFRILLTDGLISEYQREANQAPQFQLQPILNTLDDSGLILKLDENQLSRTPVELTGFTKWHQTFIRDAIGGGATYLVTNYPRWLNLSEQTVPSHGLFVVTPASFVELEG